MKLPLKKVWVILIGITLLLILTNPSIKRFKDFCGYSTYSGISRSANFLVFSFYDKGSSRYVGFFLNFIYVGDYGNAYTYSYGGKKSTKRRYK